MRTARLLTVSRSIRRGMSAQVVSTPTWGVSLPGGLSAQGGCLPGGSVCPGGVSQYAMGQTPPPVSRITDMCKNITLPQTSFAGGKKCTSTNIYFHFRLSTKNCWLQNRKLTCSIVFKGTYGHMFLHVKNISLRLNSQPHQTFFSHSFTLETT